MPPLKESGPAWKGRNARAFRGMGDWCQCSAVPLWPQRLRQEDPGVQELQARLGNIVDTISKKGGGTRRGGHKGEVAGELTKKMALISSDQPGLTTGQEVMETWGERKVKVAKEDSGKA